jgi:sulfur carrier protein ThiS
MENQINLNEIIQSGELTTHTYRVTEEKKVKDLLAELNLQNKYFAIIVDGKRAGPEDTLKEGSEIVILPKIAGG